MKRLLSTIGACILCTAAGLQAQELPLRTHRTASDLCSRPLQLNVPAAEFFPTDTLSWQLEHIRRKVMCQERRREVTDRNVAPIRRSFDRQRKMAVNWQIRLGNTGCGNWSPFPDRALDARTIRYPMARSAAWESPVKPNNGPAVRKFN